MSKQNPNQTSQQILAWCLSLVLLCSLIALPGLQAQDHTTRPTDRAQSQERRGNRVVNSFRAQTDERTGEKTGRPLWVERALRRSLTHLTARQTSRRQRTEADPRTDDATSLRDPQSELTLVAAEQDDLGKTHVRLAQMQRGVEVFGGQLIAHLEADAVQNVSGRVFDTTGSETMATLPAEQAVTLAKAALNFNGEFADEPTTKLVVLPNRFIKGDNAPGATLTWQVTLNVEDGSEATGSYQYFINAQDGQVVWHYNALPHDTMNITQTGRSQYSGQVTLNTQNEATEVQRIFGVGSYKLVDGQRGSSSTNEMNDTESGNGNIFSVLFTALTGNYVWGNGTTSSRETAAVDAHFGLANVWDYFLNTFGRNGLDNSGTPVISRVHYGSRYNNAHYGRNTLMYGDGDGRFFGPLTSLDIVAHEFAHGVTEKTAGLIYAGESGALNESFSDIFGVGAEFYADINADYLIGEDCFTPGKSGDAMRSLADPTAQGNPDHYTKRLYAGPCTPEDSNDNCGVHSNSGIMNKAFYLMAEGGTHPFSKVQVGGIGRFRAEWIFYRALAKYLTAGATFADARQATIRAAEEGRVQLGYKAYVVTEVMKAWDAVGVGDNIEAGVYTVQAKHSGRFMDVSGVSTASGAQVHQWDFWGGDNQKWQIESVGNGFYRFVARHSGMALDILGISKENGARVIQCEYWGGENQQFQIAPAGDGYYMIVARHSGKVLDVEGILMENGARLHQWDYWGGDNQKWRLVRIQ